MNTKKIVKIVKLIIAQAIINFVTDKNDYLTNDNGRINYDNVIHSMIINFNIEVDNANKLVKSNNNLSNYDLTKMIINRKYNLIINSLIDRYYKSKDNFFIDEIVYIDDDDLGCYYDDFDSEKRSRKALKKEYKKELKENNLNNIKVIINT